MSGLYGPPAAPLAGGTALAPGSIPFANASGALAGDSGLLYDLTTTAVRPKNIYTDNSGLFTNQSATWTLYRDMATPFATRPAALDIRTFAKSGGTVSQGSMGVYTLFADRFDVTEQLISGATNAAPVVVTTAAAHGYASGDRLTVTGVKGNTAANGVWYITVLSSTTFALYSDSGRTVPVAGNGAYATVAVSGATNATPIVVTTAAPHGLANDDYIAIAGVLGNTAANGTFRVGNVTSTTFELHDGYGPRPSVTWDTIAGNGAYASGGTVYPGRATNRGLIYGVAATAFPRIGRGAVPQSEPGANGDDSNCFIAYNGGSAIGTDCFYLGHNSSFGSTGLEWNTEMTLGSNANYGIRLGGYKVAGLIDTRDATVKAGGWGIRLGPGHDIVTDTVTGTKIGQAATQKIGFFGVSPVSQPAANQDIRTSLVNLGLIAGGANPLNLNGGTLTAGLATVGATGSSAMLSIIGTSTNNAPLSITANIKATSAGKSLLSFSSQLIPSGGAISSIYAINSLGQVADDAGVSNNVTDAAGVVGRIDAASTYAGTITNAYSFYAQEGTKNAGSAVISNNFGLFVPTRSIGANNWGVYVSTNTSFFGGTVQHQGSIIFPNDNANDIGNSATTFRPRDVNVGRFLSFDTAQTGTTVGTAGAAAAPPASPALYVNVKVGATTYRMPLYN